MKRLSILIGVAVLAGAALAAPKPLRYYDWNGKRYTVYQMDDGSRVEIKGKPTDDASVFLAKATAIANMPVPTEPRIVTLENCTKAEMVAEIKKRGYTAVDLGLVVKP